ncbi:hypothetical protein OAG69_00210 [bacterium]|nr:hypothetical protein [bacterium]
MAFHTSNVTGQGIANSNALSNDPANAFGDAASVRELWRKGVEVYEQTTDFFAQMEGGSDAIIETIADTTKGRGQKITFTQMAGLYNEPKHGDELFNDGDDFESIKLHSYDLSVDFLRHGVRYTERAEEFMGMRGEIAVGIPRELGKWMGRQKSEKLFMMFLHKGSAENHIYAGDKAGYNSLVSADTLDYDTIVAANTQLARLNGQPAKVGTDQAGNPIHRYCTVATTDALFSLEQDSDFKSLQENAGPNAYSNVLFKGGYTDIRGNIIKKYNPIDHDGYGAIASPLNPKADLGCDTTDGFLNSSVGGATDTDSISGGGSTQAGALSGKAYFKYFPLFQFKFLATETMTLESSLVYADLNTAGGFLVAVVNAPNAAVDPGKIGYYHVSANLTTPGGVNKLTVTSGATGRYGDGSDGTYFSNINNGDVGAVGTNCTQTHSAGTSTIYFVNDHGVPIGHTLFLGKAAARRGYGKYRNQRSSDDHEGGFVKDIFVTSVFGQEHCEDAAGRKPGYLVISHAVQYAGVPFPNVS